jgi:hypothetical protein
MGVADLGISKLANCGGMTVELPIAIKGVPLYDACHGFLK